ncbi:hypothetical protein [Nannocystis sp. SCPEA4]|uniref:hypothetical protein n=1 Tax=Nannocystis sp. SCPEA4 TaxID=2996787 RepID=UPI00226FB6FF|nr:hypothetical protein [Nannocystis sp. SCPEA4]MCY1055409.1 hypothetical protein [Nannocystis sp. SCPEA4]
MLLDRYLVWVSAGVVAGVWLIADWVGLPLSEGAKGALTTWVGMAAIKQRTDGRWRQLELEQGQMRELVERLETTAPGSPAALLVRRELVELARRFDPDQGEEG